MKKYILLITAFLIILNFAACTKTVEQQTSADEVTVELQSVIKTNNIKRIIAWDDKGGFPTNISATLGTNWSFSNGFAIIGGYGGFPDSYAWNLIYLDKYERGDVLLADGTTAHNCLIMHFKN